MLSVKRQFVVAGNFLGVKLPYPVIVMPAGGADIDLSVHGAILRFCVAYIIGNMQHPKKPVTRRKPKPIHHASDFGLDPLNSEDDLFRWFLLTYLLGKPIQSTVAVRTWQLFLDEHIDTPWAILGLSDRRLAILLHRGGYVRYQNVMTRALKICVRQLLDDYDGSLVMMIENSESEDELGKRLQKFYGVGPKTAEIFMREVDEFFARRNE